MIWKVAVLIAAVPTVVLIWRFISNLRETGGAPMGGHRNLPRVRRSKYASLLRIL